jgi:hypothetical protein
MHDRVVEPRKRRQPRSLPRHSGQRLRLTERDLWLFEALVKMRFLATRQIARLLFGGSRSAANKRLRALLDAGYLSAWVPNLSAENIYSLTRRALATLRTDESDLLPNPALPRALDSHIGHLLAINDVRVAFATDLPTVGGELAAWRSDWEIRRPNRGQLLPDAVFAVRWADGSEQSFALEVDHRTKSPRRLVRKILRYVARRRVPLGRSPDDETIILVVSTEASAIPRHRAALAHVRITAPVWFAALDVMRERGASDLIWQRVDRDSRHSLRELANLPYRKEGSASPNAAPTRASAPPPARLFTTPTAFTEQRR